MSKIKEAYINWRPFLAIMLCVTAFGLITGTIMRETGNYYDVLEEVHTEARSTVATQVDLPTNETFNTKGAVGGAVASKLAGSKRALGWGLVIGIITAEGCKVPVVLEGRKMKLSAPQSACEKLKGGETVEIQKSVWTTTYRGQVKSTRTEYVWPQE